MMIRRVSSFSCRSVSLCNNIQKSAFRSILQNSTFSTEAPQKNGNEEAPAANANATKEKELTDLLAKKDLEIIELKDLYRRALADAENIRHRTQKELQEKSAYAIQSFAKDLLSTADILSMALNSIPEKDRSDETLANKELKALWTGVSMTKKELLKVFGQYGITEYNPLGEKFDFNLHTAIFQSLMPGKEPGTVFHVDKVGYLIKDRVLRPANVGVVKDNE